jgi:hypothetical protein
VARVGRYLFHLDANHTHVNGDARASVVVDDEGKRLVMWVNSVNLADDEERLVGERRQIIDSTPL